MCSDQPANSSAKPSRSETRTFCVFRIRSYVALSRLICIRSMAESSHSCLIGHQHVLGDDGTQSPFLLCYSRVPLLQAMLRHCPKCGIPMAGLRNRLKFHLRDSALQSDITNELTEVDASMCSPSSSKTRWWTLSSSHGALQVVAPTSSGLSFLQPAPIRSIFPFAKMPLPNLPLLPPFPPDATLHYLFPSRVQVVEKQGNRLLIPSYGLLAFPLSRRSP